MEKVFAGPGTREHRPEKFDVAHLIGDVEQGKERESQRFKDPDSDGKCFCFYFFCPIQCCEMEMIEKLKFEKIKRSLMMGKYYGRVILDFFTSSRCRSIYIIFDVLIQWNQASERACIRVFLAVCVWTHIIPNQSTSDIAIHDGIKYINRIKWHKFDRYMMWWAREHPMREKNRMGFLGIMEVFVYSYVVFFSHTRITIFFHT